jgi:putative holliday junction resolvase
MIPILGIDTGEARIGLAISDGIGMLAHPLETVPARRAEEALRRIAQIVRERGIATVVVGVPRNMDGSYGPAAQRATAFISRLRDLLGCEVVPWDERLTTVAAQRALRESGRNARKARPVIDQAAAQFILQGYLDRRSLAADPDPDTGAETDDQDEPDAP